MLLGRSVNSKGFATTRNIKGKENEWNVGLHRYVHVERKLIVTYSISRIHSGSFGNVVKFYVESFSYLSVL